MASLFSCPHTHWHALKLPFPGCVSTRKWEAKNSNAITLGLTSLQGMNHAGLHMGNHLHICELNSYFGRHHCFVLNYGFVTCLKKMVLQNPSLYHQYFNGNFGVSKWSKLIWVTQHPMFDLQHEWTAQEQSGLYQLCCCLLVFRQQESRLLASLIGASLR